MSRVRIFKNKAFARFCRRAKIRDTELCTAIQDAENGLVAADLGGGVIKQRIARRGAGKSGGFRTLILFRRGERAFFVYGFAKNEQDNIQIGELKALRKLAAELLAYSEAEIAKVLQSGAMTEVKCDGETIS